MGSPKCQQYLRGLPLLIWLGCSACTGARAPMEKPAHYFDQTEMDLEHGSLEPASRYHRPHGIQAYDYDKTTVDLARPRMALPAEALPPASPASTDSPPQSPLPGGDR